MLAHAKGLTCETCCFLGWMLACCLSGPLVVGWSLWTSYSYLSSSAAMVVSLGLTKELHIHIILLDFNLPWTPQPFTYDKLYCFTRQGCMAFNATAAAQHAG